jgi:hypothetical protein
MSTIHFTEQEKRNLMHIIMCYEPKKCELDADGWSQASADLWNKLNKSLEISILDRDITKN